MLPADPHGRTLLRVLLLAGALAAIHALASAVTGGLEHHVPGTLFLVMLCYAGVLAYPIVRSSWTGARLTATMALVVFGITTVLTLSEAAVFLPRVLPGGFLPRATINGAALSAADVLTAVVIMGRASPWLGPAQPARGLAIPPTQWVWKGLAIIATYTVLYLTFGALIAWRDPAVRQFYASVAIPGPGVLLALQAARAIIWLLVAIPVVRFMRGGWWEAALAVGLLFAVLMNASHLLPSPFFPAAVQRAHLIETASSNFIFGWTMVWLIHRRHFPLSHPAGRMSNIANRAT